MKLALALAALFAIAPAPTETLEFGPKPGTKLEKRFESSMKLENRSMSFTIDGEDVPSEFTPETEMSLENEQVIVVEDEYREMEAERPLLLSRRFTTLTDVSQERTAMEGMDEPEEKKEENESKLEGRAVQFRWNEKENRYDKSWDGEGAADELLDGLEEDMDLRRILPAKSVSEGDTWKIDLSEFSDLLGPGGDFGFPDEDDEDTEFEDNLKGEVVCTYVGTTEKDGRKLARIAAVCKGKTSDDEEDEDGRMHMEFDLDLEGEFLWDIAGKHLASYELAGDMTAEMKVTSEDESEGRKVELVMTFQLEGEVAMRGVFTAQ